MKPKKSVTFEEIMEVVYDKYYKPILEEVNRKEIVKGDFEEELRNFGYPQQRYYLIAEREKALEDIEFVLSYAFYGKHPEDSFIGDVFWEFLTSKHNDSKAK